MIKSYRNPLLGFLTFIVTAVFINIPQTETIAIYASAVLWLMVVLLWTMDSIPEKLKGGEKDGT